MTDAPADKQENMATTSHETSESEQIRKKLSIAAERKEAGNTAFKEGDYKTAMRCYHEIFLYISGLDKSKAGAPTPEGTRLLTDEEKTTIKALEMSHHLNLAAIYLKLEKFSKCEAACSSVLKLEGEASNIKALFRRGKARSELGDLDGASEDLTKAGELDSADKNIQREQQILARRLKQHEAKEKKRYAGMFDQ
mmetsp:Transcript_40967/g.49719  ORF Transcript_40967/g.49719 Transcript_40967/m.49719 type:complete len:195 (+) Transcript_40967:169-753(+)|eukprot:CAMPEP_0197859106 /NCGR_PEP_ID=MMETSP1438-20131217/33462_1 /TAXON_ID=1461541 /ORGANISM="Pterosperma sp., Strain CCMP1384" /LENGTH=194 /DNA_ID=CAMNT_0043475503 /DNA_START=169 /DNA_END=753 /DNA_ORIENTATION=-